MNRLLRTIAVVAFVAALSVSGFGQTVEQPVVLVMEM
mgnify:CR=1 FL=1